jgi:signal transduction histidine kinase/CheY-like chemotaxis protein
MTVRTLEDVLIERRDQIIARFVAEVRREELAPAELSRSLLVDHIPTFLDEIVAELRRQDVHASVDAGDASVTARRHGGQRWSLGYDLEALIREYGVLRHCVLQEVMHTGALVTIPDVELFAKCVNVGATEAAAAYVRRRDEQWAFVTDSGKVLSSTLDRASILSQLTRLVVPRVADWCIVHAGGTEHVAVAHVDTSKMQALRELHDALSSTAGSSGAYSRMLHGGDAELVEVARPELVASLAPSPNGRALLGRMGATSWIVLPLRVGSATSGVAVLGYAHAGTGYSQSDLPVLQEVAARAALALENARLYELSQQARTRVEAATRAKDEFVAMVSHELRTPLNAILGWLRLHRNGALPPENQARVFEVVERNANALHALVADLLDVSRIFTGTIRLSLSLVDLPTVVELAVEALRPALAMKNIQLTLNLAPTSAVVRGDAERLQQVLWNLLSNAIKFTANGGKIAVSLGQVDSELELAVRDTGAGIAPEFLPHVFESFRQWESGSTRRHGGLGIGLSIVKHLVELHDGSIAAFSEGPGKGATFVMRLPTATLGSGQESRPKVPASRQPNGAVAKGLQGLRVLVVDDDEDARELLRVLLQQSAIEVRVAEHVDAAVAALEEFRPDVLISDIAMPGEDGYSLIRRIRMLASDVARTPAIALTAYARTEDRDRALVEGFNAHLSKPVDPEDLLMTIADLAGRPQTARLT